ncbi:hypothetical protein A9Q99_10560 [Gammaproteobacteria bacterium 45_16_T64]|nr:hypothetical protein A9Q99_10560 [Gammaproteobacteria bacterium 45_16_T64]
MANGKYNTRVVQVNDTWTAEITRKINARKVGVSKSKEGFASQETAQEWADKEMAVFTDGLIEKRKLRAAEKQKAEEQQAGDAEISDDE